MLMPKRYKYRKQMRGRMTGLAYRGSQIDFGEFGLQALEPAWITSRQIEAARRAMVRHMKRRGKVWIRIFPDKPVTAKPAETRMGSGKGSVDHYVAVVKPGRIMFEIGGTDIETAREAMRLAMHKLPIKTKFVTRDSQNFMVHDDSHVPYVTPDDQYLSDEDADLFGPVATDEPDVASDEDATPSEG